MFRTKKNGLCTDHQRASLNDVSACRSAVSEMKKENAQIKFNGEETVADWPKGCYTTGTMVYFNKHSNGSRNHGGQHICYAGKFQYHHNLFLIYGMNNFT